MPTSPFGHAIRRLCVSAILVAAGFFAVTYLRGPQGVPALMEKRREVRSLEEQNAELSREMQLKRERIKRLRESQAEQELEIRQRLKLLRPGETSFIIPDAPKNDQPKK